MRGWLFLGAALVSLVVGVSQGLDWRDLSSLMRVIAHSL